MCVYVRLGECLPKDNVVWERDVGRGGLERTCSSHSVCKKLFNFNYMHIFFL